MGTQRSGQALRTSPSPKVLLACSGLEHASRGFESFARECFEALRGERAVRLELVKASGDLADREHIAWTLRRDLRAMEALGRLFRFRPFRIEAALFALGLQPMIRRERPALIYLSEWDTAQALAILRRVRRQRFRILYCNGAFVSDGFGRLDHVQELTPAARDYVVSRGASPRDHTVLPLGFKIDEQLEILGPSERDALRAHLGLPVDRKIVISVAALNRHHKRIDYLIDELAAVPEPRPFLLVAGEPEPETAGLLDLARRKLGAGGFDFRTVPATSVRDLLQVSDLFVLASLEEMQGRSLVEAAAAGLECIAHENPVMRFALGESGIYGDLRREGALTSLLIARSNLESRAAAERRLVAHNRVYERFSWNRLRPRYVELLTAIAAGGAHE